MKHTFPYQPRELSWLSFNQRVLSEAADPTLPLYERINFLAIFSSNLDEFFRVKVAGLQNLLLLKARQVETVVDGDPAELLQQIAGIALAQQQECGRIFSNQIVPELEANGITLYQGQALLGEHQREVRHYFQSQVLAYLKPVYLTNPSHPFLPSRQLYFAIRLQDRQAPQAGYTYAYVNIPSDNLSRYTVLSPVNGQQFIITLDEIIRQNLSLAFKGYDVISCYSIKLNRDEDALIDDEFSGDLIEKIRHQLEQRKIGHPVRFLYDSTMDADMLGILRTTFGLQTAELVEGGRYHNLYDLFKFPNPLAPRLKNPSVKPMQVAQLELAETLVDEIHQQDLLLHYPYQTFDYVLRFFNEAAVDPNVISIRVTLYRLANSSLLANSLISAARNGKRVTVFVEVKARFDEANNLNWASRMQEAGVTIIYSLPGLKVHAKIALITRRGADGRKHTYSYLSTGNFNENTATVYTDHGLFTAHRGIGRELRQVFTYLKSRKQPKSFRHLLVAQFGMKENWLSLIDREIEHHRAGRPAYICLKMNGLEEKKTIDKLYEASQAGVRIDLLVRGICCLIPGKAGLSETIQVFRLVDKYLEHGRVLLFTNGGEEEIYLSSADWMNRNLNRRIEVGFPIYDPALRNELKALLQLQLSDTLKLRSVDADMVNQPLATVNATPLRAQEAIPDYLRSKEAGDSPV
ncbi:polyphosphate kinase 1 [Spirosoma aureum]|uniref:Polyphosphate kinase n=1 Tax=Spirosoma aureum TaxID=2692134 RepID=A0A6G9ANH1_9BACT|nr:polyphosphate kinase 1 [Spirosoma aureum]QIP13958.1 polyphosphate kinase 1 [Spirosoma aureum]